VALKAAVEKVREEYAFSRRRAGGLMTGAVSNYRYQTRRSDEPLRTRPVQEQKHGVVWTQTASANS